MTVSLLGDGIYFVAIAWQAYSLSNAPTALSVVGVAWTLPTSCSSCRWRAQRWRRRRRVVLIAYLVEAGAIGLIGVLAVTGDLRIWMLLGLVAIYRSRRGVLAVIAFRAVPGLLDPENIMSASDLATEPKS